MSKIEPLDKPETIPVASGTIVLTHRCRTIQIDPRDASRAVVVRDMKGYLDGGNFVDYGTHQVSEMDATGLAELLADTSGGKPAGDFRLTDITPAITKRTAEVVAARQTAADAANPKGLKAKP